MLQANGTMCSSRYRCKTHAAHKCARGVETTLPFNPFELPDSPRKEYTSEEVDEYQRVLDSLCCEASVPRGPPLRGEQDQTPRVICAFCHKPCVKRLRDMGRHLNTHRIGYVCSYDDCEHGEHQKSSLENHIRMDHTFDLLACTVILRRKTDDTPPFVCGFLSPDNRRISMHRNKCHSEWKVNKTVCSADLKQPHVSVPWNFEEDRLCTNEEVIQIFEEDDIIYDEDTLRSVYSDLETDLLTECSKKKKAAPRAPHAPATRKSVSTAPIDNSTNKRRPARTSARLSGKRTDMPKSLSGSIIDKGASHRRPIANNHPPTRVSVHLLAKRTATPKSLPDLLIDEGTARRHRARASARLSNKRPAAPRRVFGSAARTTVHRAQPIPLSASHQGTQGLFPGTSDRASTSHTLFSSPESAVEADEDVLVPDVGERLYSPAPPPSPDVFPPLPIGGGWRYTGEGGLRPLQAPQDFVQLPNGGNEDHVTASHSSRSRKELWVD